MSVQAGIWHFDAKPVDANALSRLGCVAAEFGPDGESQHLSGSVGMLYRPFHTTTESRAECQPLIGNQYVLTWDGRLDNRDDLAASLRAFLPIGPTDVAIVGAAFERWGTDCFGKLRGEWAASIWSSRDNQLILARDYIGVRQLFYYAQPHQVVWCTILRALAQEGNFNVCDEYIAGYLAFKPAADLTPYCELRSVPPGGFHLRLPSVGDSLSFDYARFEANPGFGMRAEVTSGMSDLIRRTDHRIMLNGTGGDEMNGQAVNLVIPIAEQLAHFRWREAGRQLVAWSLLTRKPALHLLLGTLLELLPLHIRTCFVERGRLESWINRQFARKYRIRDQQMEDLAGTWFWRPALRDSAQTIMTMSRDLIRGVAIPVCRLISTTCEGLQSFSFSNSALLPGLNRSSSNPYRG